MTAESTPTPGMVYASCSRRFGAMLIDSIIVVVFGLVLIYVIGLKQQTYQIFAQVASLVFYVAFESSAWRATPGKRLLGIYLADTEGNRISPLRSLARYCVLCLPGLPLILLMFSDKFAAYDASMQKVKQLEPAQQTSAMIAVFHENSAMLGQFLIVVAGSCVLSIALYWMPMIFTKQKTGLHDILAKVRVLRKTEKTATAA